MKGLRKSLAVMAAAVMLLTLVPALALAQSGEVTGTFSVNHPPEVVSITYTGSMDPQSDASITVNIKDQDDITDLETVVMKIFYREDGAWDLTTAQAAAGDVNEAGVITWTQDTDTFVLTGPGATTWALGTGSLAPGSVTGAGGDFTFVIKPGQVARETPGQDETAAGGPDRSSACWFIYAKVTDDVAQWDETESVADGAVEFDMNFWCEVTAITGSVNFGSLLSGATYDDTKQTGNDIKYVANGYYDEKVQTDATWTRTPAGTDATLDPDSDPALANNFALKADDADVLTAAVFVPATVIAIDEAAIDGGLINDITGEAGDTVANILAIQLHTTFEGGTYDGTITFVAVAHSFV